MQEQTCAGVGQLAWDYDCVGSIPLGTEKGNLDIVENNNILKKIHKGINQIKYDYRNT